MDAVVLGDLVTRYRTIAASTLAANLYRHTATAKDTCWRLSAFRPGDLLPWACLDVDDIVQR